MADQPTCGKGLAENAVLPAKLAELITSVAEVLELHMRALDRKDPAAAREYEAYATLVKEHRAIGAQLQATAQRMAAYRDLPMGRHDQEAMSDAKAFAAFERFVSIRKELLELLQRTADRDDKVLAAMRGQTAARG
jgi:hypothetical protein